MPKIITDNTGFIQRTINIDDDGKILTKSVQRVADIIDRNKNDQNDPLFNKGYTEGRDMKHVARVPLVILEQWWREENRRRATKIPLYGKEMNEVIRRKLNDPDNKFLRTGLGEIGRR